MHTPEVYKKISAYMKTCNHNVKYFAHMQWEKPGAHERASERMRHSHANISNWVRQNPKRHLENVARHASPTWSIRTVYKGITFRSRMEALTAINFDRMGWSWTYEPIHIQYWFNGRWRTYTIDFWVDDLNYYIEVKPKFRTNHPMAQAKMNACRDLNLNVGYCTEDDLTFIESVLPSRHAPG